ncbi:MAG: hypothetical protein JXR77_13050, partial [Lentisphaeria bacterium]|nr:hypothetical protein [Lentisphaeria bacterium]
MRTRRVFFLLLALVVSAVPLASVRGDLAADRIDSLQQDQEAMDGETARAIAAWARDAQATDSRTHLVEALDRCDDLLEQASSANTAAALGKRARTVAGKVAGHRRRLLKALASLDRDDARASTLRKALAACPKSSSRITRVLEKIPTAGPAVFLRDTDTREPWVVGPGETLRLTVWGLDGTGAACPAPQAAVSCPTPGVVNGPPVVTAGPPHSVSISCGNAPGVAEITIAACGIVRRAFVANLGTGEPLPPQPEVLAIVPTPTSLCTGGGWLCWSDATDQPVKTMPTTGGDVQAAAIRLVRPERLFAFDDGLLALDIRDGFSPGGGVGSGVIRALLRFDIPSGSCQTLHLAGNAAFAITTDVVVRDHCAWWVTGESSPDTYTIQCVPLDGSPPADAYT